VNKPYLPLAAGELSRGCAAAIVLGCLALGLGIGFLSPSALATGPLKATLLGSTLLGTAYSLPPLRLKRFPLLAGLCITAVRGALINWGFFAHASAAVFNVGGGASAAVVRASALRCGAATSFFLVFGIVIALLKDVPDVAGDAAVGTATYSIRFGRARVFGLATGALQAAFVAVGVALGGAALGVLGGGPPAGLAAARRLLGAAIALGFAAAVRRLAAGVDVESPADVYAFYMKCWAAFYASYAWLPLAR
jgi:homogentisate phytyltransferase/homogentisate geranylgeranyltransferase